MINDKSSRYLGISENGDAHREFPLLASTQILGLGSHDLLHVQILQHFGNLLEKQNRTKDQHLKLS